MSEQADGFMISDRQVEEEGGMHQAHEKIHNSVFISNSNINNNHSSNPFADDELLTWLQYLLDDACPDVFQHWPPAFPSPAATGGSSSSSFAVKYLPHQEDETWMVARDFDKRAAEGWISKDLDRKTDAHLKQFFHQEEESWAVKDASEQRAGGGQEENPLMKNRKETDGGGGPLHLDQEEGAEEERNEGGGVKGRDGSWVGKQLDDRQGFAKDGRNLAQLKLLAQQKGEGKAAKEAQVAASVAAHFKRSPQEEAVWMNKEPDSNRIHTALFRHLPQDEEGPGLQKKATSQFRNMAHFAEESWLSHHELQREAAAHLPQDKEGSWMKKELGRNLTAVDGTQSTSSALENPAADAALALGAGRAAGTIRPLGVEAFNKVRTARQPRQPPKLGSPPSCNFASPRTLTEKNSSSLASSILPPRIKTFGSYGSMFASQPAQQKGEVKLLNLAQRHLTKPFVGFPNIGSQENKLRLNPTGGGSNVNSSSKDIHLESSTTALSVSQDMERLSARVQQQSSAGQAMGGGGGGGGGSAAVASGIDTIDMPKLSCFSFPSQEKKAESAFSGGSQTSASFKEAVSGSKRKLMEDSECLSEDAEGESVVNSQAGNSSSKRTRANEVHNLSERRRRNRINDKMNALRELIPNASKSNKAALLDEAIDYLKNLQLQLQVMSLRSGLSMLPMVLPPDLPPHVQISQLGPVHPVGMGMSGGSPGTMAAGVGPTMGIAMRDMTYGVSTTRPLSSLASVSAPISSELRPLQSSTENDSISQFQASTTPESVPLHFCHSHVQAPSQSISSVNMNMYLQQQQQIQEQQLQMLQQFHRQQQQQGLHPSQASLPLPLPQQRPHQ